MGEDITRNMYSSFPEINKLCKVASRWKYIKTNRVSCFTVTRDPRFETKRTQQ